MLTRTEAELLCHLLDVATESNWRQVVAGLKQRDVPIAELVAAWKALEKLAGLRGTVPDVGDFN